MKFKLLLEENIFNRTIFPILIFSIFRISIYICARQVILVAQKGANIILLTFRRGQTFSSFV